ncbi:MAG: ribonucleoside-diphosphate reductase [Alphaproteobacteria bacterium]|nr:ribonucleoside-diphosphate reductase [Alphaproteobacteria bacterium]
MNSIEPLLTEEHSKYVMFPIQYHDVYEMYKKSASAFWVPDEINFAQDLVDIDKLTENEKYFIYHVLAFFAASDGIVMENLATRFSREVPNAEIKAFYAFQNAMEAIHSETYSLLIDTYEKDPIRKDKLFNAVTNFPAIKQKADWAIKWIEDKESSFAQRLVAFAIVEGLFFSASFCAIFWLRERGLLPGLSFANQLIARDESMHTDFACLLYSKIKNTRLSKKTIEDMFREAVDIEKSFITESIPCSLIGMNSELMTDYIMYIADRLLMILGYDRMYYKENPFQFMEKSASDTKVSFFERRNADYVKSGISYVAGKSGIPAELTFDCNSVDF